MVSIRTAGVGALGGAKEIQRLAGEISKEQPGSDVSYEESLRLLEELQKNNSPQARVAIAEVRQKLAVCDSNLKKYTNSLCQVFERRPTRISGGQLDVVLNAARRLMSLKKDDLAKAIVEGALSCALKNAKTSNLEDSRNALTQLIIVYFHFAQLDQSLIQNVVQCQSDMMKTAESQQDFALCMHLLNGVKTKNLGLEREVLKNLELATDTDNMSYSENTVGWLILASETAAETGDSRLATKFLQRACEVLQKSSNTGAAADTFYRLGNQMQFYGLPDSNKYWKIAVELYEKQHGDINCELGALCNYANYLASVDDASSKSLARKYIWRAYDLICKNKQSSESLFAHWCDVATKLSDPRDRVRLCALLEPVCKKAPNRTFILENSNDLFRAKIARARLLIVLSRENEARTLVNELLTQAKSDRSLSPLTMFSARTLFASYNENFPPCIQMAESILCQPCIRPVTTSELAQFYVQAFEAHRKNDPRPLPGEVLVIPSYAKFLQKSLELRGISAVWAERYIKAWFLAQRFGSPRATSYIETLLKDPEINHLPEEYIIDLNARLAECYCQLGQPEKAVPVLEAILLKCNSRYLRELAIDASHNLGRFPAAEYHCEQLYLSMGSSRAFAKKYASARLLLFQSDYAAARKVLEELSKRVSSELRNPADVRDFYLLCALSRGPVEDKTTLLALIEKAARFAPMSRYDISANLACDLALNPRYYEDALQLLLKTASFPEFASQRADKKKALYLKIASLQMSLNRRDDSAKSTKIANSFFD